METEVMLIAFIAIALGAIGLALLIYKLGSTTMNMDIGGIWLNESMNIRILLHEVDSVFQGSVIWAGGVDRILGFKVVEDLKFDRSKNGKGRYSDPLTGQQYEINLRLKRKGLLSISAYHYDSNSLAFSQEWKLYVS
jgi:Uncharacterized protein conserved in bacteria (DUF2147)